MHEKKLNGQRLCNLLIIAYDKISIFLKEHCRLEKKLERIFLLKKILKICEYININVILFTCSGLLQLLIACTDSFYNDYNWLVKTKK